MHRNIAELVETVVEVEASKNYESLLYEKKKTNIKLQISEGRRCRDKRRVSWLTDSNARAGLCGN